MHDRYTERQKRGGGVSTALSKLKGNQPFKKKKGGGGGGQMQRPLGGQP